MSSLRDTGLAVVVSLGLVTAAVAAEEGRKAPARGPLTVLAANPRYFTDGSGRAVYLTGSHTWNNLQDIGSGDPPPRFDFDAYLDFLQRHGHNFIRLWREEPVEWALGRNTFTDHTGVYTIDPHPWARTGPGRALDGKPKFALDKYDPAYFRRLRTRVKAAGDRGIYVSVMLFEGWQLQHVRESWKAHPFHQANNVNGIEGDADGDGLGIETHTLMIPGVTRLQEAYVREVIDTVGDLDNVLFEIANESGTYSTKWQYHMIRFIKDYEKKRPKQHPVGMTFQYSNHAKYYGSVQILLDSPADWISPNNRGHNYRANPPAADGTKVILVDTDHLWGIGGNVEWAWKSFLRGLNPILMDPYNNRILGKGNPKSWEPLRRNLGHTRRLAERMDLAHMRPSTDIASTTYCLANPGTEYLVYQPDKGAFTVNLTKAAGDFTVEWFDLKTEKISTGETAQGGGVRRFTPPGDGPAVLYLKAADRDEWDRPSGKKKRRTWRPGR